MRMNSYESYWTELKFRFYYSLLAFSLSSLASYEERDFIFYLLLKPLKEISLDEGNPLYFLKITEAFQAQIYMSLLLGIFISLPFIWFQLWFFMAPALYREEQKLFLQLIFSSLLFMVFGVLSVKDFLIPRAWSFFLSFSSFSTSLENKNPSLIDDLHYWPSLIPYLELSFEIFFAIVISSQIPIILFLLIHWHWIDEKFLVRKRPFMIILFLSWGALLSPPDLMSQLLIFIPLFLSYEFLIFFLFCRNSFRFSRRDREDRYL